MIKTFLFVFYLLIPYLVIADSIEENCDLSILSSEVENLAESLQVPNCKNRSNLNAAMKGDFSKLCDECKSKFDRSLNINKDIAIKTESINLNQALLKELKRSLSAQLLNIVNLRSLFSAQTDFSKAIGSCSLNAFEEKMQKQNCNQDNSLKDLKNQITEELGHLLSSKPIFDNKGLLNRENSKGSCAISDVDIQRAKFLALEEAFDENIINEIIQIPSVEKNSFEKALDDIENREKFPFLDSLSSHPVFSQLMTPPEGFVNFFKKLPRPITVEKLRANLYTNKSANDALAANIAKNCQTAFKTYEDIACSPDLKSGKVKIKSLKDASGFIDSLKPTSNEFIDLGNPNELQENAKLLNVCNIRSDKKDALDFSAKILEMNSWMPEEDSSTPYESYRSNKYENEIGTLRTTLCGIQSGKIKCDEKEYSCKVLKTLQKSKDQSTQEGRLAKSSDKNVNSLLRSFIGSPTDISPETRTTLINEGILPKSEKGDFVQQPEVAERQTDFIKKQYAMANGPVSGPGSVAGRPTQPAEARAPRETYGHENASTVAVPPLPGLSPPNLGNSTATKASEASTEDLPPDMSSYNQEILRRLSQNRINPKVTPTKEEVDKVAREVFRDKGRALTPLQEAAVVNSVMNAGPQFEGPLSGSDTGQEKATLSPGETPKQQWEKQQKLTALSGMAGAQASAARNAASSEPENENLTKVAITLDETQKKNISAVLTDKMIKNDIDGQKLRNLVKAKESFILEFNGMSYRVQFENKSNVFKVKSADIKGNSDGHMITQLESFLNDMAKKI